MFLRMPIHATSDHLHHRQDIVQKRENLLSKVDKSVLSRKQKLKFSLALSRLVWDLMIIQLPVTWVECQLDTLTT